MEQLSFLKTSCVRCGKTCRSGKSKNTDARPFRRAKKGLCENCVVTSFLLSPELEALTINLMKVGVETLKVPAIREQFSNILEAGNSELPAENIDWDAVIGQWDLPFPKGYKP